MGIPHKTILIAGLMMMAPVAVFANVEEGPPNGCMSAAGVAEGDGATIFNDAIGDLLPSGSAAVDDVTADNPLDSPVTVLVPNNAALDRETVRSLARDGNLQGVIETHVVIGDIDADSVEDGATAQTISGETVVFTRGDDGQVTASVDGGADSVTLGSRQESCSGPVYIVTAPLRPAALAPFVVPAPAPAPVAPAPAPEAPAPAPEAPAPAPEVPAPAPEAPAPVPVVVPAPALAAPAPAPEGPAPVVVAPTPALVAAPREFIFPVEGPVAIPAEVPVDGPIDAPIVAIPAAAPAVAPVVAPVVAPAVAPILEPLVPIIAPSVAPLGVAPRELLLPLDPALTPALSPALSPAVSPSDCSTLADSLASINPELLEAASAALPQAFIDELNNPDANITILSPPRELLSTLVTPDIDPETVIEVLTAHIILESFSSEDLLEEGDGFEIETANTEVTLELDLTNGVAFVFGNITANVIQADVESCAENSVIHLIDTVLFPSGDPTGTRDLIPPVTPEEEAAAFSVATFVPALVAVVFGAALLL